MTVYILTAAAILGAVFGSFINCAAWRMVHGEKVTEGRSHCPHCGHTLGAIDLIPVFSYIFLRGRCRYCKQKLSLGYAVTEILLALAFAVTVYRMDISADALRVIVLSCILLALSLIDLETFEIPDRFIIAGIIWWALTIPFTGEAWQEQLKSGLIGAAAIGGGMLLLSLLFDKVTGKESLGGGDIKLFFMTGLYLGPLGGLLSLIIACIIGIAFVICRGEKKIPFGPSISAAVFITLLVGDDVINWYLSLFI